MQRIFSFLLPAMAAGLLAGCGGDSSNNDIIPTAEGQFVDSPVSGLGYRCQGKTSVTDANGFFTCPAGSTVTFFIGDVALGSVRARNNLTVTPGLLVGAADQNNMGMLLLALDSDDDWDNGIQLPEDVDTWFSGQDIDFSNDSLFVDEGPVDNLVEQVKGTPEADLPDNLTVAGHLAQSGRDIVAGFYTGSLEIDGQPTRAFAAVVNHNGEIVGESWLSGEATSAVLESGDEAEAGMPWINMYGAVSEAPVLVAPEQRSLVVQEFEGEIVIEEPAANGKIEYGSLSAEDGDYAWTADRVAATPLPLDEAAVSYFTGGTYQVVLYIEADEPEVGPRAVQLPIAFGDVRIFSDGDVVLRIPEWHCDGMSIEDPDYADCDELGMPYGGDVSNGVITAVDAEAGTLSFIAIENNIVLEGTLSQPQVIDLAPRIAVAGPGTATLSGTWASDLVGSSGAVGGGTLGD